MRNPGTVFLYYWKETSYNQAHVSTAFITHDDKTNYLGFWPIAPNIDENTPCKAYFTTKLETDYFAIGLRALSRKSFIKKNCPQPSGIGIYLGISDALKNFELSDEDTKECIEKKLFAYAENWKVGFELGSMRLSSIESTQLTLFCEILAEKIVALHTALNLIEEIVCLGAPTECIQLNNFDALRMSSFFQTLQKLHTEEKLFWHPQEKNEKGAQKHNCASIVFRLFSAGGISSFTKKYKNPTNHFFQTIIRTSITPNDLYAMAKHAAREQEVPEKQGCACSVM